VGEFAPIRDLMELRFPYADLRAYFEHLDTCAGGGGHKHHVAPKCEFPELAKDIWNIALLSYGDHREAHRLLSAAVPEHFGFRYAMLLMHGQEEQAYLERLQINGVNAAKSGQLAKARDAMGYVGACKALKKARSKVSPEVRRAALAQGNETQRAAGFPSFERGRRTNAASGWANCKKARKAQGRAGNRKALAKAHAVQGAEGMVQAAAAARVALGRDGLLRNFAKGRHTMYHVRRGVVVDTCEFCNA
jgi:hypothetical protein